MRINITLILILFLAVILRLFRIEQVPVRLTHDEMSLGYNAYSIFKTGKDEWGRFLPLDFEAFGDHKLPAYIYFSVPFVFLMGLTPLSIKMVSLVCGILVIILTYKLTKQIIKIELPALLAGLCLAISPWAIHISRMGLESHLALALFLGGLLLFTKGWMEVNKKLIYISSFIFGLTFYAYIAYRLIVSLLVICVGIYLLIKERRIVKVLILWILGIVLIISPLIASLFAKSGLARFQQVSLFTNPGIVMTVDEKRSLCYLVEPTVLPKICKLFFHKPGEFIKQFVGNYINVISPEFLFLAGDKNTYLANQGYGEFIWILFPFYIVGLYLMMQLKGKESIILKLSFFIAPISSALVGNPQIVRASPVLPLISICIGLGGYYFINWIKYYHFRKLVYTVMIILIAYFSMQYLVDYYYVYPSQYDNAAYPLDKRVADYIRNTDYEQIFIEEDFPDSYILFAFYNQIDPVWLQQNIKRKNPDSFGFSHPESLGNIYFTHSPEDKIKDYICDISGNNYLFITKPYNKIPATETIYGFTRVHPQVSIFDIQEIRNNYQQNRDSENICKVKQL